MLGILALRAFDGCIFDWQHQRLVLIQEQPDGASPTSPACDEATAARPDGWGELGSTRMPLAFRWESPLFKTKREAERWLRAQEDLRHLDPGEVLATVPDSAPAFRLSFASILDTPLPIVDAQIGHVRAAALVDTGYSGDMFWADADRAEGVLGDPEGVETVNAWGGRGRLVYRRLGVPLVLGGMEFHDVRVGSPHRAMAPPGAEFRYPRIVVGPGILRRFDAVWFDFARERILVRGGPVPPAAQPGAEGASCSPAPPPGMPGSGTSCPSRVTRSVPVASR